MTLTNVRCRAPDVRNGTCNKKLADSVSSPFSLRCTRTRCKATTSVDGLGNVEIRTQDGTVFPIDLDKLT